MSEMHFGKLMAATSVLALALGMTAEAAGTSVQDKHAPGVTTQIKGESSQHKLSTGFLKHSTQIKGESIQHKRGSSGQILTNQGPVTPGTTSALNPQPEPPASPELNPQPEPPSPKLNPQPEPPMTTSGGNTPH